MHDWIRNHDERWLFVVLYIGFAVVLSIWISLFWLVLVVGVHFVLECIRQRALRPDSSMVAHALWEVKLDIALVLMAFALTLYMDVVLGLVGLQSAARASAVARGGIRVGARVAGWERAIRGVLLSADDVAQIARSVALRRGRAAAAAGAGGAGMRYATADAGLGSGSGDSHAATTSSAVGKAPSATPVVSAPAPAAALLPSPFAALGRWSRGDWFAIGLGVASTAAIVIAPFVTSHTFSTAAAILVEQMRVLPGS